MSELASPSTSSNNSKQKWAWVFPGQGTQHVGMGQALAQQSAAARAVFEQADEALGFSLSSLCFEGPDAELVLTKNGQPAILAASMAALAAMREARPDLPEPAFALGHSLGEYSALTSAGFFRLADALRLVRLRGEAQQNAVPAGEGKMAAIMGADEASVAKLCEDASQGEVVSPANFNAPGQIVIAGLTAAVDRACALAKERSLKAIPLKVSAPFHCSLMAPAAESVERALRELPLSDCRFPIVVNVTAEPLTAVAEVTQTLLKQVAHAVLFEQSVRRLKEEGVTRIVEIGPGKVLAGLIRRIDKSLEVHNVSKPEDVHKIVELL